MRVFSADGTSLDLAKQIVDAVNLGADVIQMSLGGGVAAACWRQIVPYLISTGKVERIDSHVVERYCIAYETYRKCYDDILQNGEKIEIIKDVQDNTGKVIDKVTTRIQANPMERLKKDASAEMTELGQQLGLSPKSRQELQELAGEKR